MNIDDLEQLKLAVNELLKEAKKLKKLSEKSGDRNMSPKQSQRASVNANYQAMYVRKLEYRAHALAVDVGIADVRYPRFYDTITFNPSGFQRYEYTPDKPKCLKG